MLTDAGPLVAVIDRGERHHRACVDFLGELSEPMVTSWPAFTEAMYLLGSAGGWRAQAALWRMVAVGGLEIALQEGAQLERMQELMEKYRDRPMDLADASLVALAEEQAQRDIFTLEHSDFSIYRINGRKAFRVWPRL